MPLMHLLPPLETGVEEPIDNLLQMFEHLTTKHNVCMCICYVCYCLYVISIIIIINIIIMCYRYVGEKKDLIRLTFASLANKLR